MLNECKKEYFDCLNKRAGFISRELDRLLSGILLYF